MSKNKLNLREILVVDVEATCWEEKPPGKEQSEIIEIGVATLHTNGEITPFREILVKPTMSKVSTFCTKLTTLTQEQVDAGMSLKEASELLISELDSRNKVWASYGDYDEKMFRKAFCSDFLNKPLIYPFNDKHHNVKNLFALNQKLDHEVGMHTALRMLNINLEGTHHRGKDDAVNIAKILRFLLWGN